MAGYYGHFIPHFATIASPLTNQLMKGHPEQIQWDADTILALTHLKQGSSTPVLYSPDFILPFLLQMDTSNMTIGAVLSQNHTDGEHPVVYLSCKLQPTEHKYLTIEREALVVKWAVEIFQYYLANNPFILVTDHAPLQWLHRVKDSNQRVLCWYLALPPLCIPGPAPKWGRTHKCRLPVLMPGQQWKHQCVCVCSSMVASRGSPRSDIDAPSPFQHLPDGPRAPMMSSCPDKGLDSRLSVKTTTQMLPATAGHLSTALAHRRMGLVQLLRNRHSPSFFLMRVLHRSI